MRVSRSRMVLRTALAALLLLAAVARPAVAQKTGSFGPAPLTSDMLPTTLPTVSSNTEPAPTTSVSFIDSAIPFSHVTLRYDNNNGDNRPTRAEFLYPKGGLPFSPGPPLPETRIDEQQASLYAEAALGNTFSFFARTPYKWVNPEVNPSEAGLGNMDLGLKYAFISTSSLTTTFQARLTIPSRSGPDLSNYLWSIEPALLLNCQLIDYLTLEGELRYWASLGGKDFAGDVARYGLGLAYGEHLAKGPWLNPVAEVVGWTVVSGRELVVWSPTAYAIKHSAGETIVNGSLGLRMGWGSGFDIYAGYSRAFTGDVWYRDTYRVELRLLF